MAPPAGAELAQPIVVSGKNLRCGVRDVSCSPIYGLDSCEVPRDISNLPFKTGNTPKLDSGAEFAATPRGVCGFRELTKKETIPGGTGVTAQATRPSRKADPDQKRARADATRTYTIHDPTLERAERTVRSGTVRPWTIFARLKLLSTHSRGESHAKSTSSTMLPSTPRSRSRDVGSSGSTK